MAGLDPAISLRNALLCHPKRDHRVSPHLISGLPEISTFRAFTEKTESRGSPAGTNRIQGSYWNGGQHGWRNRIRRICVGALLVRGKMALPSRKLRSNLE